MKTTSDEVRVRPATEDDDLDALHAGSTHWIGASVIRALFDAEDGAPKALFVAEIDGVAVGTGNAVGAGVADGRRGIGDVWVLPEHRGRGAGSALWAAVLEVCTPDRVPGVAVRADAADETSLAIAQAHGLVARGLHLESELDLLDVERLRGVVDVPDGIVVEQLREDATEEDWRTFYAAFNRFYADAPDVADGAEPMPYSVLRAVIAEPWQVTLARQGADIVGLTAIIVRDPAAGRLNTWFTGVAREARGRGLSTALKATQAVALASDGWRVIVTQNMEGNDAILACNRRLGFTRTTGSRDLTFDFDATAGA